MSGCASNTSMVSILIGDCIEQMRTLLDGSVNCCITSPPYFGLRDYGADGQIGLESTPDEYVQKMIEVFREVRRVLRDDATLWLNLGDSYASGQSNNGGYSDKSTLSGFTNPNTKGRQAQQANLSRKIKHGLKQKDLIGIPWKVAFALQADGWYLRQDIIWCLSGGTWVYAKTQKGEMPTTIKDLYRLDPKTVKLWNGEKWTQMLGISRSPRTGDEIELVLRSGERISCTKSHKFPTNRGLLSAGDIKVGDKLQSCKLPEPCEPKDCALDEDAAWFAGLYLAEGSISGNAIQISGHAKEAKRWENVKRIAQKYGGTTTRTIAGNKMDIRVYGGFLHTIIKEFVGGRTSKDKHLSCSVWKYSNSFLAAMIDGYLSGDGHKTGDRWRLGFCRNYGLERDLRIACSRLGYSLTLNMSRVAYNGGFNQTFRGEIRKSVSTHWNNKDRAEVVEIRKARARQFYDIGVEDKPHLFALASGILTHNSKPNPMPESVKDRCTKAHEYVFLLSKSARYYYDADAIRETARWERWGDQTENKKHIGTAGHLGGKLIKELPIRDKKNRRSVWTVTTTPFKGAHFATFPPKLIEPMVLAGCPKGGTILDPFGGSGTTAYVANGYGRKAILCELNPEYEPLIRERLGMPYEVKREEPQHEQLELFNA